MESNTEEDKNRRREEWGRSKTKKRNKGDRKKLGEGIELCER